jgi:hypothetical protein
MATIAYVQDTMPAVGHLVIVMPDPHFELFTL